MKNISDITNGRGVYNLLFYPKLGYVLTGDFGGYITAFDQNNE